jgi:hypothetical protein
MTAGPLLISIKKGTRRRREFHDYVSVSSGPSPFSLHLYSRDSHTHTHIVLQLAKQKKWFDFSISVSIMKSRKQLEAQQRYKKEQEERQRIKNEELRYILYILHTHALNHPSCFGAAMSLLHMCQPCQLNYSSAPELSAATCGTPVVQTIPTRRTLFPFINDCSIRVCVWKLVYTAGDRICPQRQKTVNTAVYGFCMDDDHRLEMERRRREQQEKEEQEARIKKERQIREVQLCRTHCERSTALLTTCTTALASWSVQQWQLKKVGATI